MPLERKILLSVLVGIVLLFIGYLLYSTYYTNYIDVQKKIAKYQKLIEGTKHIEESISTEDIQKIENLINEYTKMFFTQEESKITNIAPDIKNKLLKSGINIKQYENSSKSVRYVIDGSKNSLLNFLYRISSEQKNYKIPLFNIRMIDNNNFQGVIEVSKPTLSLEAYSINYKEEVKEIHNNPPFYKGALNPLGVDFEIPKVVEEIIVEEVVEEKKVLKTDKFTFVGYLKGDNEKTTLFKERENGRVFKFQEGKTLSDWTYIGENDGKYIFKKDDAEYEVHPWLKNY